MCYGGATCLLTARNPKRLQDTLENIDGDGHLSYFADLNSVYDIETLVSYMPKLDGVVCCAGIVETKMLKFTEEDDLLKLFNSNTFSAIRLIRSLVQQKCLNNEASVVMISSISGVKCGYLGGSLYGATKGALEGFTKAIALELAPQKVRVNTITPGMVETPLLDGSEIE
jgi:NAD(P)-dependent dehydrogenase (short-subunit alcohol dehydrogenase family)